MRTSHYLLILSYLFLFFSAGVSQAVIVTVDPSGGGDYTTIGDAVAGAPPGATILIAPGLYPEYVIVEKSLDFEADGLPGSVIWDGEHSHRILKVRTPIDVSFTGIEFRDGYDGLEDGCGVAIHIDTGADVTIDQCRFIGNHANHDGAVYAGLSGTTVNISNSHFEGNYAQHNCPAVGVLLSAVMVVENCTFFDNTCPNLSGAVASWYADFTVHHCLFVGNSGGIASAIRVGHGTGHFYNNTFHDNDGGNVIHVSTSGYVSIHHNIMTTNPAGNGLYMDSVHEHSCNLYYDLAGYPVTGGLGPGDIVTDPLFCDYPAGDFHLCSLSPALAENNDCGEMGAFSMGCEDCGPIANEDRAWGAVKQLYD
jgi:hypothetical protein